MITHKESTTEMKTTIFSLALLLSLSFTNAEAQSIESQRTSQRIVTWSDSELPAFSIQISASKTPPTDASFAKGLDVVYEYKSPDGLVKYFFGKYASYAEANKEIKSIRSKGFDSAFIVNLRAYATGEKPANGQVLTTGGKPLQVDPNKDYVIQVGAFRYPLYISFFENVGDVYEYRLNDKIFRYTTKPIKGTEVKSELQRIQGLGYNAAFVVEYSLYAPYRIE